MPLRYYSKYFLADSVQNQACFDDINKARNILGGCVFGDYQINDSITKNTQIPLQPIIAQILSHEKNATELWTTGKEVKINQQENLQWSRSEDYIFGTILLDDSALTKGQEINFLQNAAEKAYHEILQLLEEHQMPYIWRVWNFIADINTEQNGLEKYRHFNIGRQKAFEQLKQDDPNNKIYNQIPVASALGLIGKGNKGKLSIAFLAGKTQPQLIENPRQVSAYHYPSTYGPKAPFFSRAAIIPHDQQEILFIAGTASIIGHQSVHIGNITEQCRETMVNIEALITQANTVTTSKPYHHSELCYRVYIRREQDFQTIKNSLAPWLEQAQVIYMQADICRHDLLVEIEGLAIHER